MVLAATTVPSRTLPLWVSLVSLALLLLLSSLKCTEALSSAKQSRLPASGASNFPRDTASGHPRPIAHPPCRTLSSSTRHRSRSYLLPLRPVVSSNQWFSLDCAFSYTDWSSSASYLFVLLPYYALNNLGSSCCSGYIPAMNVMRSRTMGGRRNCLVVESPFYSPTLRRMMIDVGSSHSVLHGR